MPLRFAPRWYFTLLTVAAVTAFTLLGAWQWNRGVSRAAAWEAFAKGADEPVAAATDRLATLPRYTRVRLNGTLLGERQFLLDNMSHAGRPGYEVLTVLQLADGSNLLVNRGWLPFSGYRDRLPDVALAESLPVTLTGRLSELPAAGLAFGRQPPLTAGPWPRVTTFPTLDELEQSWGGPLRPGVLLLDPDSGAGYLRQWRPPGIPPDKHFSYAVQWWVFASVAFGLFVSLNLKRVK